MNAQKDPNANTFYIVREPGKPTSWIGTDIEHARERRELAIQEGLNPCLYKQLPDGELEEIEQR
ncbi:MAG: hypothetical protein WD490_02395 [Opitutales bacterium]